MNILTVHILKEEKKKVRYDFLFVNDDLFNDYNVSYDYDGAVKAGSDHAAIILKSYCWQR